MTSAATTTSRATSPPPAEAAVSRRQQKPSARNFYVAMALAVLCVVLVGFSSTVNAGLFHPPSPRPWILYAHATVFSSWVLLFLAQTMLARVRRIAWHRRLGVLGIGMGALIPVVGIATAIVMGRLHYAEGMRGGEAPFSVPLFDMTAFAVCFWLAIYWRRRPEFHRRLMLMATCGLTSAAFSRFPTWIVPDNWWYIGVDLLILIGVASDWIAARRVHVVYRYAVPAIFAGQAMAMWLALRAPQLWVSMVRKLLP